MDDKPAPRGILFILELPEDERLQLQNSIEFDHLVAELFSGGHCILPSTNGWIH